VDVDEPNRAILNLVSLSFDHSGPRLKLHNTTDQPKSCKQGEVGVNGKVKTDLARPEVVSRMGSG
jgi:hypothetical protein